MQVLYPINEIFYSIQGEAYYAGTPAIFIRLQGCDVGCSFCDTKHTWAMNQTNKITASTIIDKTANSAQWAYFDLAQIIAVIDKYKSCTHIVITGGEPALYNLQPLILKLESLAYMVQVETSGTYELSVSVNTWVTLSPKINMINKKKIIKAALSRANEIKMPIGKIQDIFNLKQLLANNPINHKLIWLQPLSCKNNPTQLCIEQALANNWRLSLQTHKFISIR